MDIGSDAIVRFEESSRNYMKRDKKMLVGCSHVRYCGFRDMA